MTPRRKRRPQVRPMSSQKFLSAAPILLVKDVSKAANYWRDKLGFEYDGLFNDPPDFCIVQRGGVSVMLAEVDASIEIVPHWKVKSQMWNVYIYVEDVDSYYEEVKQRGGIIDYHIGDKPYGCREFGVQDLEGHDIAIGQIIE